MMHLSSKVTFRHELKPGDLGYIIYLHGSLYSQEYNFDSSFETYVAIPLVKFARSHTEKERLWIVEDSSGIVGTIAVVRDSDLQAQLRWLLLAPEIRGFGIGRKLMEEAISFSKECGYVSAFFWTVDILHEAAQLYRSLGFEITEEITHKIWGVRLCEQRYELKL
jgi:GNAT superfamily N-acetyltransferase